MVYPVSHCKFLTTISEVVTIKRSFIILMNISLTAFADDGSQWFVWAIVLISLTASTSG